MSYYNKEPPTCKYCSTDKYQTKIRFKKNELGKWIVFNMDGTEHTREMCEKIKNGMMLRPDNNPPQNKTSYQPNHQARISTASPAPSSTFSRDEEPKAQGVTIFSLHVTISELRKEVKELRKQIETLASIADSTAQKTELLINKIGYPAPEIIKKPEPEIKAQQRHPTQEVNLTVSREEVEEKYNEFEVINPMRVAKDEDNLTPEQQREWDSKFEHLENAVMQWQTISEAFVCHNCSGKCHNGYMKLGTKLCPNCKDSVESNETEDDRSDVNNYKPRSIEDINEDL